MKLLTKKLQWKVKHTNNFSGETDFLETILQDNGVLEENIKGFLRPMKKHINDPFLMNNMDKAVELVHKHVHNNSRIFVRVDCDVDGNCSSAALIQFLQALNPELEIEYKLNFDKKHGLFFDDLSNYTRDHFGLIIVPDASMTVAHAKQITNNFDADILVLDHHLVDNEFMDKTTGKWITREEAKELYKEDNNRLVVDNYTNYCLAVNCTDGTYPNPTLCGAGVVQKFIEAYVSKYDTTEDIDPELEEKYLDLVSLACISDNMDLRNLETRYYTIQGTKERYYNNEFLNELVLRNSEEMKYGRYIISLGWVIGPKINGVIRYGKPEEQTDMFRAMLGVQETIEYQPRRKHKEDPLPPKEYLSLQRSMARISDNIKSRQDNEVRKFCNEIEAEIAAKNLDKNTILFVDGTKILSKGTVSGLVANRLASKFFRPVVLMRSKDATTFGGSMRGNANCPIDNTKEFLEEAGVTCMGHSNASGIQFPKDKLDEIIAKCNEMLPPDQLTTVHTCDWEILGAQLQREQVLEVAENYAVFGSTVPEPLFAITNIDINASEIQAYGQNANFISFTYNGIKYVKKYCQHDEYDKMTGNTRNTLGINRKNLRLNVIGQFVLNTWEDKIYPEVKIIAFDSAERDEEQYQEQDEIWEVESKIQKNIKKDEDFDW